MIHHHPRSSSRSRSSSTKYDHPRHKNNGNSSHYQTPSPVRGLHQTPLTTNTDPHDWHSHHAHHPYHHRNSNSSTFGGAGSTSRRPTPRREETASVMTNTLSVLEAFSTLPEVTEEDDRNNERVSKKWSSSSGSRSSKTKEPANATNARPYDLTKQHAVLTPWSRIPGERLVDRPPVAIVVAKKKKKKNKGSSGKVSQQVEESWASDADSKTRSIPRKRGHEYPAYELKRKRSFDSGSNRQAQQHTPPKAKRVRQEKTQSQQQHANTLKLSTQVSYSHHLSDESLSLRNGNRRDSASDTRNQWYTTPQHKATPKANKQSVNLICCSSCGIEIAEGRTCACQTSSKFNSRVRKIRHEDNDGAQLSSLVAVTAESQRWTEIMIPANLLKDELHKYLVERRWSLTESDSVFLSTWGENVDHELKLQNDLMLKTMDILDSHKSVRMNIAKERDAQVTLQAESRRIRAEDQQISHQMATLREESRTNTAVIRLLDAIDTMRLPVERKNESY